MAGLTGRMIKEKYAPGQRNNSFYEIQKEDPKFGREYITEEPERVYYINKRTGHLDAKETSLLW